MGEWLTWLLESTLSFSFRNPMRKAKEAERASRRRLATFGSIQLGDVSVRNGDAVDDDDAPQARVVP
jgi:hypothetical protein